MQTELAVEQAMMYTARVEAACVSKSSDTVHPAKVQLHFLKSAKEEKVPFEYIDGEKAGISFRKSDYEGTELMLHLPLAEYILSTSLQIPPVLPDISTFQRILLVWSSDNWHAALVLFPHNQTF